MQDLTGQKFGHWTILSCAGRSSKRDKNRGYYWNAVCVCGTERSVATGSLVRGVSKSCGCRGRSPDYSRKRYIYTTYRRNAITRNYSFDLTEEEFFVLLSGNCFYCGIEPQQRSKSKTSRSVDVLYNGIDRKNNSLGYTPDNVVSCCGACNIAKQGMTIDEFLGHIARIYNHTKDW